MHPCRVAALPALAVVFLAFLTACVPNIVVAEGGTPSSVAEMPAEPSTTTASAEPATESEPTGDTTQPAPSDNAQVELVQAVTEYTDAYFAGDWDVAYTKLWSERCKANDDARNGFLGTLMAQDINFPEGSLRPTAKDVVVDRIDGTLAVVSYGFGEGATSGEIGLQPWVHEDDQWRFDDC